MSLYQIDSRDERKSGHMNPFLIQMLSSIANHLQMKISFSPRVFHRGNKLLLRVCCTPTCRWSTEGKFSDLYGAALSYYIMSVVFLLGFLFSLFSWAHFLMFACLSYSVIFILLGCFCNYFTKNISVFQLTKSLMGAFIELQFTNVKVT